MSFILQLMQILSNSEEVPRQKWLLRSTLD